MAVHILPRQWLEPIQNQTAAAPRSMLDHEETFVSFVDGGAARRAWALFRLPGPGRGDPPTSERQCLWDRGQWRFFHPPAVHGPHVAPDYASGRLRPLLVTSNAMGGTGGSSGKQSFDVSRLTHEEKLALLKQLQAST